MTQCQEVIVWLTMPSMRYPDYGPVPVKYEDIRPRARSVLPFVELDLGMDVLIITWTREEDSGMRHRILARSH